MGWQDAPVVSGQPAKGWQSAPVENQPQQEPYTGQFFPLSNTPEGGMKFDPNAGILGPFYRAVTLPMDALKGKVDPKSEEGIGRALEAGAVMSPVSAGTRGGLRWAGVKPKPKTKPVKTPTGEELVKEGGFDYNLARRLDVRYYPRAVQNWAFKLKSQLLKDGYSDKKGSAPLTHGVLDDLLKPTERGAFVSIDNLQSVKLTLQNAAKNFNKPTDQDAAIEVIRAIDEFIARPDPESVMAGPAAGAGDIWTRATKNYGAGKRSERLVDDPVSLGERAEQGRHVLSAGSTDKTIRDRLGSLLTNEKTRAGFSDEELAILKSVKDGTAPRNIVSIVGNWMNTGFAAGSSLMAAISAVAYPPAILGAIPGAVVLGAKAAGNLLTKRALNKASEKVRQRSPLYQERVETAPPRLPASPATRSMMGRTTVGVLPAAAQSLMETLEKQQITPQQYEEYLRQKYARDQGA